MLLYGSFKGIVSSCCYEQIQGAHEDEDSECGETEDEGNKCTMVPLTDTV